jgi:hypothetical protein
MKYAILAILIFTQFSDVLAADDVDSFEIKAVNERNVDSFFSIVDAEKMTERDMQEDEKNRAARTKVIMEYGYKVAKSALNKMEEQTVSGEDAFSKLFDKSKNGSDTLQDEFVTNTAAWLLIYNQVADLTAYGSIDLMTEVIKETNEYNALNKRKGH